MSTAFMFTGTDHLVTPARYLPMLPANAPFPKAMVFFTGLCEMSGAVGLLTRRWRRPAAMMLALYLICETPANVKMAVEGVCARACPPRHGCTGSASASFPSRSGGLCIPAARSAPEHVNTVVDHNDALMHHGESRATERGPRAAFGAVKSEEVSP
jgi:hypothetical protein